MGRPEKPDRHRPLFAPSGTPPKTGLAKPSYSADRHAPRPGTPILHMNRFTRGRGKFHAVEFLPAAELPDADFPLILTTGRVLYHWHGGEISRRAEGLLEAYPEALIEVRPDDAAKIGLNGIGTVR